MSLLFLSYLALFCSPLNQKPPVSFTEEYIEFRLRDSTFIVNGNYFFVNHTANAVSKKISYPFPVPMSEIDSVHIFDNGKGNFLAFEKSGQAVLFQLLVLPYDTVKLNIYYEQKSHKDTIRYILTTTKNWGEPLQKAEYTFETEQFRKIQSFSYPPDKSSHSGNSQKYYWHRKDFLPEKDFIVVFRKK